jgi:protein-glucosylgalactosylhydroxylysine glucosidase
VCVFRPAKDTPIKQADAIMLNYPLNWNYSVDIMKNDLMFYETLISDRTPAMTWSWFTIGWKWVNENSKMRSYFLKSYQDYIVQPFKVIILHILCCYARKFLSA